MAVATTARLPALRSLPRHSPRSYTPRRALGSASSRNPREGRAVEEAPGVEGGAFAREGGSENNEGNFRTGRLRVSELPDSQSPQPLLLPTYRPPPSAPVPQSGRNRKPGTCGGCGRAPVRVRLGERSGGWRAEVGEKDPRVQAVGACGSLLKAGIIPSYLIELPKLRPTDQNKKFWGSWKSSWSNSFCFKCTKQDPKESLG